MCVGESSKLSNPPGSTIVVRFALLRILVSSKAVALRFFLGVKYLSKAKFPKLIVG
jgi:hypothetical protein